VTQIYNVYSLGLAVLSVIFLQWLLLYERRHEEEASSSIKRSASSEDLADDDRPPSPDIELPSITVNPPSPSLSSRSVNVDDSADTEAQSNKESPNETASPPSASQCAYRKIRLQTNSRSVKSRTQWRTQEFVLGVHS